MGTFITFEGGDGAGKTTQAEKLADRLGARGPVTMLREPGGTALGNFIYSYVNHRSGHNAEQGFFLELGSPGFPGKVEPIAELFLFVAARAQLVREVIQPALERDEIIICDRFADSTTAYQGYGRDLSREQVAQMNEIATGGLKPDLTILLDIDPDDGLARVPAKRDRIEGQSTDFHRRVRDGYLEIYKGDPDRFLKLDATQPIDDLHAHIWSRVAGLLGLPAPMSETARKLL